MSNIRLAAVAGHFYPDDPEELRQRVCDYLAAAAPLPDVPLPDRPPRAIIAPHAGYVYSGPVAASAYASLLPARTRVRRVVLLGPSHRVALRGLARSTAEAFRTPLGDVPLEESTRTGTPRCQAQRPGASRRTQHRGPSAVPAGSPGALHDRASGGGRCRSRRGRRGHREAGRWPRDRGGGQLRSEPLPGLRERDPARPGDDARHRGPRRTDLAPDQACGSVPINGLLHYARRMQLTVTTLDLRNSGDTAGPRHQVVGYGAYAIH